MEIDAYRQMRDHEESHWWFRGRKAVLAAVLRRAVAGRVIDRALDLGCGVGGLMDILSTAGRAFGTDTSLPSLVFCRGRGLRRLFTASGSDLPLAPESFDLITAFDTLEHIPDDDATLRECRRILRPGGLLVASGPAYPWLFSHQDRVVHHQRRYTLGSLGGRLRRAGFRVVRRSYYNTILFPVILPALLVIKARERLFPPPADSTGTNVSLPIPRFVNRILEAIFRFERHLVPHISFPAGHSLVIVAEKAPVGLPAPVPAPVPS